MTGKVHDRKQSSMTTLKKTDIKALIALFERSIWDELYLTYHGAKLFLSKDEGAAGIVRNASTTNLTPGSREPPTQPPTQADGVRATVPSSQPTAIDAAEIHTSSHNLTMVRAPSLGFFYAAPKPGAPAFVSLGAEVDATTEMCLLEVMQSFTTVQAGISGTVREICVADGELVEYGQILFRIEAKE